MSFLQTLTSLIHHEVTLQTNDIIFILIVSFYLGMLYERSRKDDHAASMKVRIQMEKGNGLSQTHTTNISTTNSGNQSINITQISKENVESEDFKGETEIVEIEVCSSNQNKQDTYVDISVDEAIANKPIPQPGKLKVSRISSVQLLDSPKKQENQNSPQIQLLNEKLKLDGTKIQERGKFELLFEKGNAHFGLIRKIEKHEIITDYILKGDPLSNRDTQLVPFKYESALPNDKSVVEVEYYQNYQSNPPPNPIIEKRIIELSEKSQRTLSSLFEHGKFRKLYRNVQKIGEGGFGVVYEAFNMIQSKKYAIKKIFMNKNAKQIENLLNQIKILNSLSHPNMVKYNTCWLEYAELSQNLSYQQIIQNIATRKEEPCFQEVQEQREDERQFEQSYVSSKNSAFSFIRSSKDMTKQSIKLKKKSSNLAFKDQDTQSNTSNSFGLLPVMYIQMELCEHSLAYYIRKRRNIDRCFCYEIMHQLIVGVTYIHTNKVVHRDLKPENILFATSNGQIFLKIGDFGLALMMQNQMGGKFQAINTRVGTPSYIAPELYIESMKKLSEEDLQKADTYSLAVIYYQLLNKFDTSHERGEKLSLLKHGKVAGINEFKEEKKLIQDLIRHNRPIVKDIPKNQNWKKLSEVIQKAKKKAYRQSLNKKESASTNFTSNSSAFSSGQSQSYSAKKSKAKNKNKHKNRHQNQQPLSEHFVANEDQKQNTNEEEEIEKENSDQIQSSLFEDNLPFIRRISCSNSVQNSRIKNNENNKRVHES